jgi:hypothetical protein
MGHRDHTPTLGAAGGIATLDGDTKVPLTQLPAQCLGNRQTPGEHFFGSLLDYPSNGSGAAGEIQYVRVYLTEGVVLTEMRVFVESGGSATRYVRLGIYSQTDPTSASGVPVTREAQTDASATDSDNGTFKTVALSSSFTVEDEGYYWLAIVADSVSLKFAVSASFRAGYLPVRREAGSGTTLPATAGTLTNPTSALIYVATVE